MGSKTWDRGSLPNWTSFILCLYRVGHWPGPSKGQIVFCPLSLRTNALLEEKAAWPCFSLDPRFRQRCWASCQIVKCFCSIALSHSFLMTFTKESKLLARSGIKGKGMKTRLMVECTRGLGYLVLWMGTPEYLLLKDPWTLPQPLSLLQVWWRQRQKRTLSSVLTGEENSSWAFQRRFHRTLVHCLYHVLGYHIQQDKKKCKILEWACIITILLRVSASQAEVIHSLFWSCSSPL